MTYEEFFGKRLAQLRISKNISAREMSLALGQNCSYINRIENQKTFPSMQAFFYICEYLEISPKDFFDMQFQEPVKLNELIPILEKLNKEQLNTVYTVANSLYLSTGNSHATYTHIDRQK